MKSYELTYIIASSISSEEAQNVIKDTESFIQSKEGIILSSQKTGAQVLAYPIKKHASGYFSTAVFQAKEAQIKEIKGKLDKEKTILRATILVKKPVKEMKARRTKKPTMMPGGPAFTKSSGEVKKVEMEEIDKQLDQILGE